MAELKWDVIDTNPKTVALTGNSLKLIKYQSTVRVKMYAVGAVLNLDTCIIRNGSSTVYGAEGTFDSVESGTFTLSAEDDAGNVLRAEFSLEMVDYVKLTCNASVAKIDASGEATFECTGNYFNGSFGAQSNTLSVQYMYKAKGGDLIGLYDMDVKYNGNAYSATATRYDLDYESTYEIVFIVEDAFYRMADITSDVMSKPVFHWGASDVTFEVPVKFNTMGVYGLKIADHLYLGENQFCRLYGSPDGTLNMIGNGLVFNGKSVAFSEYGAWTPQLSCSGVYWGQSGWYSKSGNVVTVGFYLKAYTDTYYDGQDVIITGLPYIPVISAAGGGMCSGALIQTTKNFQCFVAETDGRITVRVQACDYTSGALLETSASGCKYSSSGELTLSGTITYMTN